MRRRTALVFALAALLLLGLVGCSMTDYQLTYTLTGAAPIGGNYVRVSYTLNNTGNRDLVNATMQVSVLANDGSGFPIGPATAWTPMTDLSVGEMMTSYVDVYFSASPAVVTSYKVTAVGWDDSGSTGIF